MIFGPPGSGKGTLSKILACAGGHMHLSTGDIFRALSSDSELGKQVHDYMVRGEYPPDELVMEIFHQHLEHLIEGGTYRPNEQFLLMDGIPRTLNQAKLLDHYLEVKRVLLLDVADQEVLVGRLQSRALIEGRADDADVDVLRTRMELYQKQTAHVLDHYPDEVVSHVNADQKKLEVLRDSLIELAHLLAGHFG